MILEGSRYEKVNILIEGNTRALSTRRPLDLPVKADDYFYKAKSGQDLDQIAFLAWGRHDWWWILCDTNDIINPFEDLAGKIIRIISLERIALEVLS